MSKYCETVHMRNMPFSEKISEQFQEFEEVEEEFSKISRLFDVDAKVFEEQDRVLKRDVLVFDRLKDSYWMASADKRPDVLAQFEEAIDDFKGKVEELKEVVKTAESEAWFIYHDQIFWTMGYQTYKQFAYGMLNVRDGKLELSSMLQDHCRRFAGNRHLTNGINPFIVGFRLDYQTEKSVAIFHGCGKIQIYMF